MQNQDSENDDEYLVDEQILNLLFGLKIDNIDKIKKKLSAFVSCNTCPMFFDLFSYIVLAVRYRPQLVSLYCELTCSLYNSFPMNDDIQKKLIEISCFIFPGQDTYFCESYRLLFLHELVTMKFFKMEFVVEIFSRLFNDYSGIDHYLSLIFIWFAPEIDTVDHCFFIKMKQSFIAQWEFEYTSLVIYDMYQHFLDDNWDIVNYQRKIDYQKFEISKCIVNDNIDGLQNLLNNSKMNVNYMIPLTSYEWREFLQRSPTLIQLSAFYGSLACFKYLLLSDADLSLNDYEGKTVIHYAIAGGNTEIIRILQQKTISFCGALQVAAKFHRNDVFYWLLDNNLCELNEFSEVMGYVLHQATISNNFEIIKYCFSQGFDVNTTNTDGWTPLHFAAKFNNYKASKILLSQENIDVNIRTSLEFTALHLAAIFSSAEVCEQMLTDKRIKIDINATDNYGATPLHYAARNGHLDILKFLLKREEIDVNCIDKNGDTPLHLAGKNGHKEIIITLLEYKGIKPNIMNNVFSSNYSVFF